VKGINIREIIAEEKQVQRRKKAVDVLMRRRATLLESRMQRAQDYDE